MTTSVLTFNFLALLISVIKSVSQNLMWRLLAPCRTPYNETFVCVPSTECCCTPSWVDRGLSRLLHVDLHWLDVPERVQYKLGVTVRRCQQPKALQYLTDCVTPASDIASRQRLHYPSRHQLLVPRYQLSSLGRRSFAVAGPTT